MEGPQTGIYVVADVAVGSLAPRFHTSRKSFMVTNVNATEKNISTWCADLVPAGEVPHGRNFEGMPMWHLEGHPEGHVFISRTGCLIESTSDGEQLRIWILRDELKGHFLREPASPPLTIFPTENFKQAIINKDPDANEVFSPSTNTIVEACAYSPGSLPEDPIERQKEVVRLYTAETPLYHEMNSALRGDHFDKMRYFAAYIKELRDVFKTDHENQIITPFEGTVWRGITFPDSEAALKDFAVGSDFVWSAFTSMTTNREVALGFGNIVFEIRCCPPAGTYEDNKPEYAPASVQDYSDFAGEDEILFPPNTKFRVVGIQQPDDKNELLSPLIMCETMGFDTDEGIVGFQGEAASGAAPQTAPRMASSSRPASPSGRGSPEPLKSSLPMSSMISVTIPTRLGYATPPRTGYYRTLPQRGLSPMLTSMSPVLRSVSPIRRSASPMPRSVSPMRGSAPRVWGSASPIRRSASPVQGKSAILPQGAVAIPKSLSPALSVRGRVLPSSMPLLASPTTYGAPQGAEMGSHTVQVPKVQVIPKVVEVPQIRTVPKYIEERNVHISEVVKHVPKIQTQVSEKYVDVPDIRWVNKTVEIPEVRYQEFIKEVPNVQYQERVRQVEKPMVQYVDKIVEVPQPVPVVEKLVHVPKIEVREVEHRVRRPPEVQVVEKVVEVPQVRNVQRIIPVPKTEVREHISYIPRTEYRRSEKIVHVPQVRVVDKIVEVPKVRTEERVRHVPKYEMETITVPGRALASYPSPLVMPRQLPTVQLPPYNMASNMQTLTPKSSQI
mmetsp:Transcript_1450/g.3304  ORF Transcript_1450/g.3304 Transcript_1450/m.3304 type:complete len:783 (+) Transcript_1450:79-2427(+)